MNLSSVHNDAHAGSICLIGSQRDRIANLFPLLGQGKHHTVLWKGPTCTVEDELIYLCLLTVALGGVISSWHPSCKIYEF